MVRFRDTDSNQESSLMEDRLIAFAKEQANTPIEEFAVRVCESRFFIPPALDLANNGPDGPKEYLYVLRLLDLRLRFSLKPPLKPLGLLEYIGSVRWKKRITVPTEIPSYRLRQFLDEQRACLIENKLEEEMVAWGADLRDTAGAIINRLERELVPTVAVIEGSLAPIERDIVTLAVIAAGFSDGCFVKNARVSEKFHELRNLWSEMLSALYDRNDWLSAIGPQAPLFTHDLIEPDLSSGLSAWDQMQHVPGRFLRRVLFGEREPSRLGGLQNLVDEISPAESFDRLILDSSRVNHIKMMCNAFASGSRSKLIVFLSGAPGAGKSSVAHAIASHLNKPILRVALSHIDSEATALAQYLLAKAKGKNAILVFEECEDLLASNRINLLNNGWAKVLLEEATGAIIFTSNRAIDSIDPALRRRMSYVWEFETLTPTQREALLFAELQYVVQQTGRGVPNVQDLRDICENTEFTGGELRPIIELAAALSPGESVSTDAIKEAFGVFTPKVTGLNDVIEPKVALNDLKLEAPIRDLIGQFVRYALAGNTDRSPLFPKGAKLLLSGPSGTGKSMLAQAVFHSLNMRYRRILPSSLLSKWVGGTEAEIRSVFEHAAKEKVGILIDEAESLLLDRQGSNRNYERTQAAELLQRIEHFPGVLVITTNHSEMVDAAFGRRFIFRAELGIPSAHIRSEIWMMYGQPLGLGQEDFVRLAEQFSLSPAEIQNVITKATILGMKGPDPIAELCDSELRNKTGFQHRTIGLRS